MSKLSGGDLCRLEQEFKMSRLRLPQLVPLSLVILLRFILIGFGAAAEEFKIKVSCLLDY
jgi:hypothetical protein